VIANSQDVVELLIGELGHRLRVVTGNIDSNLPHCLNGLGANLSGMRSSTGDLESISCIMPEQTFRHLAARGIARTENQDALFTCHA
jgi:hypothetical protein